MFTAASTPLKGRAEKVVLFGFSHLSLADLNGGRTPRLDLLFAHGAVGATSIRTQSSSLSSTEAYVSLGAGARLSVDPTLGADRAFGESERPVIPRLGGGRPRVTTAEVRVDGLVGRIQAANSDGSGRVGALGDALHRAHLRTGVVGNADRINEDGTVQVSRPVAAALMDSSGSVDFGTVGPELLRPDPSAPFGRRADAQALLRAMDHVLSRSDVVLVDPGDTERAAYYSQLMDPGAAESARQRAIRTTDDLLGRVVASLPPHTMLIVTTATPAGLGPALTPMVITGPGVAHGSLYSVSTKRASLVTLTDVAPTVLAALGVRVPSEMVGAPLRHGPGTSLEQLLRLDQAASIREAAYYPASVDFLVVQAALFIVVAVTLGAQPSKLARRALRFGLVVITAWPLATFICRGIPIINSWRGASTQLALWLIAGLTAALACRAKHDAHRPLLLVCAATIAVLIADLVFGTNLELSSILGYSPYTAARFSGIGNNTLGVLGGCAVVLAALLARRRGRTQRPFSPVAILIVVAMVAMLPTLGNKVGSIFTLVPSFAILAGLLFGRRISWRAIGWSLLGTTVVFVCITMLDLVRPPAQRTHLGRFAYDVIAGNGSATDTILRKIHTNIAVSSSTIWLWMIPIASSVTLYALVVCGQWKEHWSTDEALRAGLIGLVLVAGLGWLTNDSGVIVPALTLLYLGPYLLLPITDANRVPLVETSAIPEV